MFWRSKHMFIYFFSNSHQVIQVVFLKTFHSGFFFPITWDPSIGSAKSYNIICKKHVEDMPFLNQYVTLQKRFLFAGLEEHTVWKRSWRKAPSGPARSSRCHRSVGEDNHFNMWRRNGTLPFCCHYIVSVYFLDGWTLMGSVCPLWNCDSLRFIFLISWSEAFQNKASFSLFLCFISEVPNRIRFWRLGQKPLEQRKD